MHSIPGNPADPFPPVVGLVDDADLNPAGASALNVAPTNLADRTAWLFRQRNSFLAENWQPITNGGASGNPLNTYTAYRKPGWDPVEGQWLYGVYVSGTGIAGIVSHLGSPGATAVGVGNMGSPFPSAAGATMVGTPVKDPSDATTYYLTAIDGTGAANVWTLDTSTGIYTLRFTDSLAVYTDSFLIYAFGSIIWARASSATPAQSKITYSTNKGATWLSTSVSGSIQNVDAWTGIRNGNEGLATQLVLLAGSVAGKPVAVTTPDGVNYTVHAIAGASWGTSAWMSPSDPTSSDRATSRRLIARARPSSFVRPTARHGYSTGRSPIPAFS